MSKQTMDEVWAPIEGHHFASEMTNDMEQSDTCEFKTRLQFGIHWIEDAVSKTNGGNTLYPERVEEYCYWDA